MATRAVPTTVKTAPAKQPTGLSAAEVGLKAVFIKPASEYVPARLPTGKILFIKGQAIVRHENGELRELHAGDVLTKGDMVLTSQNGYIQIESPGNLAARQPDLGPDLARAELNLLDVAPAAGMDGDPGNLTPALQVDRVSEVVSPSDFVFDPATSAGGYGLPTLNSAAPPAEVTVSVVPPTIGIGPGNSYTETSGAQPQFSISLSGTSPQDIPVTLTLNPGPGTPATLTAPGDFAQDATTGMEVSLDGGQTWTPVGNSTITIPAGQTGALVRLPAILDDNIYEGPEQLTLTVSANDAGTISTSSATATITDEEDRPKVNPIDDTDGKPDGIERVIPTDPNNPDSNHPGSANWTVAAGAKTETDTSNQPGDIAYFRINLSGTASIATTLHVQAADGLAKVGTDYSNLEYWNGTAWTAFTNGAADISVPANTSSLLLRTTVLGDNVVEPAEAFKITAYTDAQTAAPVSQDIAIVDDDAAPVATADTGWGVKDAAINGNVIQGDALGGQADTDADDGTAGLHLVSFSATVGGATQTATLDASGSASLTLTGVGTLLMRADGSYTFTPLAGYTGQVPQIGYTVADSSNVNTAQGTLDLSVLGFSVVSSATGGTYAEALEPHVQYTVTFDSAAPAATTVTLAVQGGTGTNLGGSGTATDPADFKADVASNLEYSADGGTTWSPLVNGQAILPAGKTELLVRTPQVNNDALYEGPEQLTLTATVTAPGGTSVSASGVSTITDEEDKPKVNPNDDTDGKPDGIERVIPTDPNNPDSNHPDSANWTVAAGAKTETDTSNQPGDIAYFRINLSGTASIATTLHVQAADGLAKVGTDYSNLEYWNGTAWTAFTNGAADISVPANTSSLLLRTTVLGDNVVEPAEAFKITAYTDAQTATPISRDIAIADDDAAPVATAATPTVAEDSGTIVDPALLNTRVTGTLSFSDADDPTTVALTTFTIAGSGTVHTASSPTQTTPTLIQLTDASGNAISGAFFYLKSNGEYGYILPTNYNSQQSAALPTVTYTVSDGTNSSTSTLALTVTPVNDAPIARADQSQTLIEASTGGSAGTSTTTGNVISGLNDLRGGTTGQDTDVDSTTLTVIGAGGQTVVSGTPLTLSGTYGTLQINSDGSYTYTLDNSRTVTDALKATDKVQDVFSYTVSDGNGGSATASLAVNIQGANDAPTIVTDPTTYSPVTVSENALSSGTGTSTNASAVASTTRTITVTDNDSDLTTLTYRFDLASLNYIYGSGTGASTQTKLLHFDSASRKYYDVSIDTALYNSSNGQQLTWYADLNGNGSNDGGSEDVLRLTLTQQSSSGNSTTLLYKVELLGSLYHNTDFDLTYSATDEWSMDPHNGVDLVALKDLQISISDGTGSAATPVTVNVADDQPAIISSSVNTGADKAYVYQWNVLQKIGGVPVHLTYWLDYDTVNQQYHAGYMTYLDDPMASSAGHEITGISQAADASSLSESTPYYIDAANNKLYIYSSLDLIHEIDLVTGTSTAQNQPSTGYVNEMIEFVMLDYDGDFFTKPVAGVGSNPFVSLDTTGNSTSELVNGTALGDTLRGAGGNDTIYGDGMDAFGYQDRGADLIIGGQGNDVLYGGSYGTKARGTAFPDNPVDDQLASSYNSSYVAPHTKDVFAWQLGDGGSAGSAATDTIKDFDTTVAVNATGSANSGDVLNLKDLLINEHDGTDPINPYNLDQFLQVTVSNGSTMISVSTTGGFNGSNTASVADQVIQLDNVDLSALLPTGTTNTSDNIIKALIDQKRLVVDT